MGSSVEESKSTKRGRAIDTGLAVALVLALAAVLTVDRSTPGIKGLYGLRTRPDRDRLASKLGASPDSEQAVANGLKWLARHQADDGHWSDCNKCENSSRCSDLVYRSDARVAETGMAILAFQAGGHYYFNDRQYSDQVRSGLDWLINQQGDDGRLFGTRSGRGHDSWYQQGIATFALAEACAVALAELRQPDSRYLNAARQAIQYIQRHQYRDGGWRYGTNSETGDSSVTGWQVLAIKSALEANINVSSDTMEGIRRFFASLGDPSTGETGYTSRGSGTHLTTAVGLIVQEFFLDQPDSPLARKAIERLEPTAVQIGEQGDYYTIHTTTLAMFLAGGEPSKRWNSKVRDAIVKRQETAGCARGSWSGTGWYDGRSRTLATAWAVLTLEVYYRYATESIVTNTKSQF